MAISVLVVDSRREVVQGFNALLSEQSDVTIVSLATCAEEAIELVGKLKPGVVVMGVTMSSQNDVDTIGLMLAQFPEVNILGLVLATSRRAVSRMFNAGASGCVLKTCSAEELVRAIKAIAAGKIYLSPEVTCGGGGQCSRRTQSDKQMPSASLDARELQILQGLADGASARETAAQIRLTVGAVEFHRRSIMDKLGISGIGDLKEYALQQVSPPPQHRNDEM